MEQQFRPCVLGVISDDSGRVLVAERVHPRGAWQFPQGGIDPGESAEEAIQREIFEELGIASIEIIKKAKEPVRYIFPPEVTGPIVHRYVGQEQIWFHLKCPYRVVPDLAHATDKEFVAYEWVTIDESLKRIVHFKKDAYLQGLELLGFLQQG